MQHSPPFQGCGVQIVARSVSHLSPGAALECPGRKPGVFSRGNRTSTVGATDSLELFRPYGAQPKTTPDPGLRPGLHSVAAPRLNKDAAFAATFFATSRNSDS